MTDIKKPPIVHETRVQKRDLVERSQRILDYIKLGGFCVAIAIIVLVILFKIS